MAEVTPSTGPMDDDELAAWLEQKVTMAVGFADSKLVRQREIVGRYYDADEPKPFHKGNSKYVSQDVFDAVESMKAQLVETFTGNLQPVRFAPQGAEDVEEARIATEYTSYVVYRQNDGYFVIQDVIHEGLMYRVGIAQVSWNKDIRDVEEVYPSVPPEAVIALIVQEQQTKTLKHWDTDDNADGTKRLTITHTVDRSQVCLECVPQEEFGISPRAKSIAEAEIVYRRAKKAKSDLIRMGYDKKLLDDIWTDDKVWLDTEPELIQRFEGVDDQTYLGSDDEMQDARRKILVYDVFTELDIEGSGVSELYRICYAGNRILEKEKVARKPFIAFQPLRRPHSYWGTAYAERVIPTQNARTILRRATIDHAVTTTNPRYKVMRNGLANPKELIEQRVGGMVTMNRPDAIAPLDQAPLNPYVFQLSQALGEDKEHVTGISALSQGLNKDAISKQNSADMVQQMVSVSQTRQKMIARNFAEGFLKELFLAVYQLVIENTSGQQIAEIAGNYVQVNPEDWVERKQVMVEFNLGYGEQDKEFQKWTSIDQYMTHNNAGPAYGPQQRFNVVSRAFAAQGIKDVDNYYLPPNKQQPPPPDPHLVLAQQEMQIKQAKHQLDMQKAQAADAQKTNQTELKAQREALSVNLDQQEMDLKNRKFEHDMVVDAAEIALQRKATEIQAIPKPVG